MEQTTIKGLAITHQIAETSLRRAIAKGMSEQEAIDYCLNHRKQMLTIPYKNGRKNVYQIERENELLPNSLYNYLKSNPNCPTEFAVDYLKRIQSLPRLPKVAPGVHLFPDEAGNLVEMTTGEVAKIVGCSRSALNKNLSSGDTSIEEAIAMIKNNQPKYYLYLGEPCTIKTIARKTGVPKNYLYLKSTEPDFEKDLPLYLQIYKKRIQLQYENITLHKYCVKMGYNYKAIYRMVIQRGFTTDQAVEHYRRYGSNPPTKWNYEYQCILTSSLCLKYGLDSDYIRTKLREGKSISEAMEESCFCSHTNSSPTINNRNLMLYRTLLTVVAEERLSILQLTDLSELEKTDFERQYNKISIIKRDLLLIELYRRYTEASPNEKLVFQRQYQLIPQEVNYMETDFLSSFVAISSCPFDQGEKKLTKSPTLYYNKPISNE